MNYREGISGLGWASKTQETCFVSLEFGPVLESQSLTPWVWGHWANLLLSRLDEENSKVQSRSCGSRRAGRRALRSISWSPTWSPGSSDTGVSMEG